MSERRGHGARLQAEQCELTDIPRLCLCAADEQTGRYNGVTNNGLHRELQRSIFFARMARGEEEPSPAFLASKSCHWVKSIMTMSAEDPVYCKSKVDLYYGPN